MCITITKLFFVINDHVIKDKKKIQFNLQNYLQLILY